MRVIIAVVALLFSLNISVSVIASAAGRVAMPYHCQVTPDGRLSVQRASQPFSYAIVGERAQRPFKACIDGDGPGCRTFMVHRFDVACAGYKVPWSDIVGAIGTQDETSPSLKAGRLSMTLVARAPGSETLPWQKKGDRARVFMPKGFAPVGELGARFVLPNPDGSIIVGPDSTTVDAYSSQDGAADALANIDLAERAYAQQDPSTGSEAGAARIETASLAVAQQQAPSWQAVVHGPGGGIAGATGTSRASGPGFLDFVYFMIVGSMAFAIFAGGYALRTGSLSGIFVRANARRSDMRKQSSFGKETAAASSTQYAAHAPIDGYNQNHDMPVNDQQGWTPGGGRVTWQSVVSGASASFGEFVRHVAEKVKHVAAQVRFSARDFANQSFGRVAQRFEAGAKQADNIRDEEFRSGLNIIDMAFRYSSDAVFLLDPAAPLREVLNGELKRLHQRYAVLKTMIGDGSATPERASATMRRLTCELERIRRIAASAAETHGEGEPGSSGVVPQSSAEAYALLGVNSEVTDVALKKIVDGLRMSWHPDLARDPSDRDAREVRIKQINIAWDLICSERAQIS